MTMLWYTPGPASSGKEEQVLAAGATGVRLTFSYSTQRYQAERAAFHRDLAEHAGIDFLVVADLAGEKFRLGEFTGPASVPVQSGQRLRLVHASSSDPIGDHTLAVPNSAFFANLEPGDVITVGDGSAMLQVLDARPGEADLEVRVAGTVNQSRGLTVRGGGFRPKCLTAKDLSDLEFVAASALFDAVALSFVADATDVLRAREVLAGAGRPIAVIAKIETQSGVSNIKEICEVSDMVMAARGDLALAIPWVDLPDAVTTIADAATASKTAWIVATQIVEGLERFVIPTRAEICDLAHWMRQGCAGVLVSYETAFGANPVGAVQAVRTMVDSWAR